MKTIIVLVSLVVCFSAIAQDATYDDWYQCLKEFDANNDGYLTEEFILYKGKAYAIDTRKFQLGYHGTALPFCVQFDRSDESSIVWMDCGYPIRFDNEGLSSTCQKDSKKAPCPADQSADFKAIDDKIVTQWYHPLYNELLRLRFKIKKEAADLEKFKKTSTNFRSQIDRIDEACYRVRIHNFMSGGISRTGRIKALRKLIDDTLNIGIMPESDATAPDSIAVPSPAPASPVGGAPK